MTVLLLSTALTVANLVLSNCKAQCRRQPELACVLVALPAVVAVVK